MGDGVWWCVVVVVVVMVVVVVCAVVQYMDLLAHDLGCRTPSLTEAHSLA